MLRTAPSIEVAVSLSETSTHQLFEASDPSTWEFEVRIRKESKK